MNSLNEPVMVPRKVQLKHTVRSEDMAGWCICLTLAVSDTSPLAEIELTARAVSELRTAGSQTGDGSIRAVGAVTVDVTEQRVR